MNAYIHGYNKDDEFVLTDWHKVEDVEEAKELGLRLLESVSEVVTEAYIEWDDDNLEYYWFKGAECWNPIETHEAPVCYCDPEQGHDCGYLN